MTHLDTARRELEAALRINEQEAERIRGALQALGGKRRAATTSRRRKPDLATLPERALRLIADAPEPVAAGRLAPVLHVSPAQARELVEALARDGRVREAGQNRRGATLYEA